MDEGAAAGHEDGSTIGPLEVGDGIEVGEHRGSAPLGIARDAEHDVLGHRVHAVGELALVGRPGLGEAPPERPWAPVA